MRLRETFARVDLGALRNNFQKIKALGGGAKVCAVVKADAYGHGAVRVARALESEGVDFLAVALAEEAVELREAGIAAPVLVLGEQEARDAEILARFDISLTLNSIEFAEALSAAAAKLGRKAKVHIKIETGMNRQGVEPSDVEKFSASVRVLPGLDFEGVYSHFADADNGDGRFTNVQYSTFLKAVQTLESCGIKPRIRHIANSPTLLFQQAMTLDMVRSGILLYGLSPTDDPRAPEGFLPAMRFETKIASIKEIAPGETVSYGRSFVAEKKTRIALLRVGYADGYPRSLSNRASVLVRGSRAKVAGRVCMDMTMVDITGIPDATPGDDVILFGTRELPAGELASIAGTIDYEIACLVSKRVPRVYVDETGRG